jgi:undecaprenyl diphosphate synthase
LSLNQLRHIAIIMDGNNRWAKQRGKSGTAGHKAGVERIRDVMASCREHGVDVLTLFAFSSENWQRPRKEVDALMGLFLSYLKREAKKLQKEGVKLRVIGNRERFSERIQQSIIEAEALACEGSTTLVIAADYGGRWDIAEAAKQIAAQVLSGERSLESVDEEAIQSHIALGDLPAPDLLIRTGGDCRISNFLLWQAAYTELYFCDQFWPDFDGAALDLAVEEFHTRQRRYGLSGDQVEPLQEGAGGA